MNPIGENGNHGVEAIDVDVEIVGLAWSDVWTVTLGEDEVAAAVAQLEVVTGMGATLKVGQTSCRGSCRRRPGEAAGGLSSATDTELAVDIPGLSSKFVVSGNDLVLQITATASISVTVTGTVTRL